MIISSMARIALVSVIFAAPALAQAPAGNAPAKQDPAPKQDAPATKTDTKKYAAITSLIREHRDKQVAMVKLWREIKSGKADEKTREQYDAAKTAAGQAGSKVTQFISQERWTEADRDAMNKMWSEELTKPIE